MDIQMKWFYRLGFLLLLFIVLYVFLKLQPMLFPIVKVFVALFVPFIIAAFIAYLLHPVVEWLNGAGLHRGAAVLIIYVLFFGAVGLALYRGIPILVSQLKDLSENAPIFAEHYREWVASIQDGTSQWPDGIQDRIEDGIIAVERYLDNLLMKIINGLVNIINSIFLIALIPFIAFYMLKDYGVLTKMVWYLTPRKWRKQGSLFLKDVDKTLGSYIRGQLLVCAAIGSFAAFLFWAVGMNYSLLLGLIVGITNVIPYFGPVIGIVPALIIAATISLKMVIYVLIIVFVLQFLEGNILSPFIVGKSLQMHPLFIMFALLAGGEIGGILGLVIAVPVLAVLKTALVHGQQQWTKRFG